ncbi:hypothetical protein AZF37_03505 [endosymbiont 'TC1' of Trimyema compressum]|uniref:InlB B-repeat-containing protein n=1 Tax=endosymbiont 'TC1' of Trimyema compressum TaxID=243899 RepID=UPI0007F1531F|nr:InlB B-repeat-containing protein [endosymbiont 'TC1' of Trimyema compressum]AMP20361.1 hypothetical protein AZF37_03505 [endosymbiont 'TC1' of Trimyema compressum]
MYEQAVNFIYKENAPLTYKVTYDGNLNTGGTLPLDNTDYLEGQLINNLDAGDIIKDGYTFKGWNTAADGSGKLWDYAVDTMPARNITLYAQWEPNEIVTVGPEVEEKILILKIRVSPN